MKKEGLISVLLFFLLSQPAILAQEKEFFVAKKAYLQEFYEVSARLFKKFIEKFPQDKRIPEAKLFLGKALFYRKKYKESQKVFKSILSEENLSSLKPEIFYWLGEIEIKAKRYREAIGFLKEVVDNFKESPSYWRAVYSLGLVYSQVGSLKQAEDIFRRLIRECPSSQIQNDGFYQLSNFLYKEKQFEELGEIVKLWFSKYPESSYLPYIYFFLGEVNYNSNDFAEAKQNYEKALSLAEDLDLKSSIYQSLGWVYLKEGNYEKSEELFQNIVQPDLRFYCLGSLSFKKKRYSEAIAYFDSFLKKFGDSPLKFKVYLGKAESLYELGRFKDAVFVYGLIINNGEIKDKSILEDAYYGLGWCYLRLGEYKKAIKEFKRLSLTSQDALARVSAQINIGDVYQEEGHYQQALDTYEKVIKEFPDNFYLDYIQFQIGLCFLKKNDFEAALLAFKNLIERFPDSRFLKEGTYYLALTHIYVGNLKKAEELLKGLLSEQVQDSLAKQIYILLMNIYDEREDTRALEEIYRKASQHFPEENDFLEELKLARAIFYINQKKNYLARKILESLVKDSRSRFTERALLYLGGLYYQERNLKKARYYYSRLIEDFKDSPWVYEARLELSQIAFEEDKYEEAKRLVEENLTSSDKKVLTQSLTTLIELLIAKGDFLEALNVCDRLINEDEAQRGFAYFKKGNIYEYLDNYKEAYKFYLKALESNFNTPEVYFSKACALEKMGEYKSSLESFFEVVYLFNNQGLTVKSYLHIAKLYEKMGKPEEALKVYEKLAGMDVEESKYAREKKQELSKRIENKRK